MQSRILSCLLLSAFTLSAGEPSGKVIYERHCASCHGEAGEGVAEKYDEPLYGDRNIDWLARYIERSMPEEDPDLVRGEEAVKVARYIHGAFYSPAAREKVRPSTLAFSRLTVRQHQQSVADLFASFRGRSVIQKSGGLLGRYTSPDPAAPEEKDDKGKPKKKPVKKLERQDAAINFQFGAASPMGEELDANEFRIEWNGSLFAEETGVYEFFVKTENGVRLWLNQEIDIKLIDGWVSTGEMTEHRGSLFLLGGRHYPLRLSFFKYRDKSASIVFEWKPPHRPREVIPARYLSPQTAREIFVSAAAFPPDDASAGYARGVSVSKGWDEAVTQTAIEAADFLLARLDRYAQVKPGDEDREAKVKALLRTLAGRAFRQPLSDAEAAALIDARFAGGADLATAVRRTVLHVLKSPRFLYPELAADNDWRVASRIALALWDSLPGEELLRAAERGELHTEGQVSERIRQVLGDGRTRAKLRDFFHHWLHLDKAEDLAKDPKAYPGFDEAVAADLRASLELFLDEVVWGEGSDYRRLLTEDKLLFNERLAGFYGVKLPAGEAEFRPVALDPAQRAGVLTHPLLLSAFAYYKSSSPIHRGVFLSRNVLGRSLKPPVTAIEFMDDKFDPSLTMREKVTELTKSQNCMACHAIINPLGFALEQFDATGRRRQLDNGKPVNSAAEYTTAEGRKVRLTGARDVARHALESPSAQRAFVEQLFQALVKQPVAAYGPGLLDRLLARFVETGYNIQELMVAITTAAALHGLGETPGT
jgi:hypothetical protein